MSTSTGDTVSRIYGGFRGVDFRGEEVNLLRSPDSLNMWKDYKHTESIRTRPGMAVKTAFDEPIYGIYFYSGMMLVHSGTKLYKVENGTKTEIHSGLNRRVSKAFVFNNTWYFKDGKNYFYYFEGAENLFPVIGYIPTTTIGRKPEGGGTTQQDVNMLSDYRRNTFAGDGESKDYYLDVMNLDTDDRPTITVTKKVDDKVTEEQIIDFTVDYASGKITFTEAPPEPYTDGQDNVSITFKKTVRDEKTGEAVYHGVIEKCTMIQVFDNRVFFSGNPEYPNHIWHCSLNDPTYVSDTDHYEEGTDTAAVRGMVAGNNALWVFREPSDSNANVFYHTPYTHDELGKAYPYSHSSITIGCIGKAINFNDDIVFFSDRGMEGISGDITTEQVAAHRSSLVDGKLLPKTEAEREAYKNMILEEWEGYLLCIIGKKVFLADSRTAFTNENHIEYDWFYWELEREITCTKVHEGVLYLGTEDGGIYTLTDTEKALESYWVTPTDKFKVPHKLKTTNKRGCVVEATGDISVYAKTEDTGFELIGEYNGVEDYFVSRIKRKKFKDIQLKFASNARFSLETATLECVIGGYIKR